MRFDTAKKRGGKALVLSNQSRSMLNFWRVLIKRLEAAGYSVVCCVPAGDDEAEKGLEELGARIVHYRLDRKGLNPLRDLASLFGLWRIFRAERPDLVFATTIKPVIYGCLAARMAGIADIYATITGLGYAFEADSPLKKAVNRLGCLMYRAALANAAGVFFQNRDDLETFRASGILRPDANIFMARGTGVDLVRFLPAPFPPFPPAGPLVFLLVGRLLEAKGLFEYAEAAAALKKKYPDTRFQLLGPEERGLGGVPVAQVRAWQAAGVLEYLGESRDVRREISGCHVLVLPSWREGVPTVLMEGMAMGRPCVATDVPGCREVVREGETGFLCPRGDAAALGAAMERFVLRPALVPEMGARGRRLAEDEFDAQKVAAGILENMGAGSGPEK